MTDKFANVPKDKGTWIMTSLPVYFGKYEVLYQKWAWSTITAESLIFSNEDLDEDQHETMKAEILASTLAEKGSQITVKRGASFTFFNFNFETD